MKNTKLQFITKTAVMLALLIGVQFFTRGFGQFVTGSLVNMILLVSTFLIGTLSGVTIAALSPFLAFQFAIGPQFIQIVPFQSVGNIVLVLIAQLVKNRIGITAGSKDAVISVVGLISASALKALFLWVGIKNYALPLIPDLAEKQAAVLTAMFSWPQLVTALVGSALTTILVPILKRALKQMK